MIQIVYRDLEVLYTEKSVSNQRIEAWWGTMRRQGIQWWISFFKDLKDNQEYDELNPLHV
jgi:hypothetical protein